MPASLNVTAPPRPQPDHPTSRARRVWVSSREAAEAFLTAFDSAQVARGGGAPSNSEQDLLRAMLVFACAGLDSSLGHLVRDCASDMLTRSAKLRDEVDKFVQEQLDLTSGGTQFFLDIVRAANPLVDERLVTDLMDRRTANSLQSHEAVLRISSYFEIGGGDFDRRVLELRPVFAARNVIIHEMDVNFEQANRRRTSRTRATMVDYTELTLGVTADAIRAFQAKLAT